jgi:hypothetical protein
VSFGFEAYAVDNKADHNRISLDLGVKDVEDPSSLLNLRQSPHPTVHSTTCGTRKCAITRATASELSIIRTPRPSFGRIT